MTQSKNTPKILITGATGNIGRQLVAELTRSETPLRLAVRRPEAIEKTSANVEVVRFDYDDADTFPSAFAGVDTAFMVAPSGEGFSKLAIAAIAQARAAGVRHIVRYSAFGASPDSTIPLAREHGAVDEAVVDGDPGWTILQPTFYQDNLLNFSGQTLQEQHAFYGSSGDGKASFISSADIAAVAAKVLQAPSQHDGQRYVLTGPEALSAAEVAQIASEVASVELRYVDVGDEGLAASLRDAGMPQWFADSMVGLERLKREGNAASVSGAVGELLGRPPERYRAFLERNRTRLPA